MEIYGSDIRLGGLHEGGSLNGWKLPSILAVRYRKFAREKGLISTQVLESRNLKVRC
jgi:hypothetical protein